MKDLAEVCPLSREVILQPLSVPLQGGFRFFRFPLPAFPLVPLRFPTWYPGEGRAYRVLRKQQDEVGSLYAPVVLGVHEGDEFRSPTHHGAFWLKPVSIFGLFWVTARKRAFTSVNQCHPS